MDWCPYCSGENRKISHGGPCPRVKVVEYHENGLVKRIEFHDDTSEPFEDYPCVPLPSGSPPA